MHQPSFLEFLKAQYLRNFLIHLLKKGVYIYLNTACVSNKINMLIPIKIGHISKIKNKKKDIYNKNMACPSKKRICISQ